MDTRDVTDQQYSDTLNMLVVAHCLDFFRRKAEIEAGGCAKRTRMEYVYLNKMITEAAQAIVGEDHEIYIREIGEGIGYAKSALSDVSEGTYKRRKKEVKISIARKLHLLD